LAFGVASKQLQVFIVSLTICCCHVSYINADDPEQSLGLGPVPGCETCVPDRRVWQINLHLELVLKRNGMIADYVKLAGLDRAGLNTHSLFAEVKREPINDTRTVSLVALIDYSDTQRDWLLGRRNLALTLALVKLVGILDGANELQSIKTAEAVLIGKKPPAGWTFFHGSTLLRTARLY